MKLLHTCRKRVSRFQSRNDQLDKLQQNRERVYRRESHHSTVQLGDTPGTSNLEMIILGGGGGGGVATQKNRTLPQISNLGLVFFGFFSVFFCFFSVFPFWPILTSLTGSR